MSKASTGGMLMGIKECKESTQKCGCCYLISEPILDLAIVELALYTVAADKIKVLCKDNPEVVAIIETAEKSYAGMLAKVQSIIEMECVLGVELYKKMTGGGIGNKIVPGELKDKSADELFDIIRGKQEAKDSVKVAEKGDNLNIGKMLRDVFDKREPKSQIWAYGASLWSI